MEVNSLRFSYIALMNMIQRLKQDLFEEWKSYLQAVTLNERNIEKAQEDFFFYSFVFSQSSIFIDMFVRG